MSYIKHQQQGYDVMLNGHMIEAGYIVPVRGMPSAGASWGSDNYQVTGYFVAKLSENGSVLICEPPIRYAEHSHARAAAALAGDGYGVSMQVDLVGI